MEGWNVRSSSWLQLMVTMAAFSIATAALSLQLDRAHKPPAAVPTVQSPSVQPGIGLKVSSNKQGIEIRWDHQSPVIAKGDKGILKISDGEIDEVIPLDQQDLEDGYVSYKPLTNDVHVRIEITHQDGGTFTESARVVSTP